MLIALAILFIIGATRHHYKNKPKPNYYINEHKKWQRNEVMYKQYLNWCEKEGEIPMNKEIYIKNLSEKDNKIKILMK